MIDHERERTCFLTTLSQEDLSQSDVIDDTWSFEFLPPLLKIHQSVLNYMSKLHLMTQKSTLTDHTTHESTVLKQNLGGILSSEGLALSVQFLRIQAHEHKSQIIFDEIVNTWKGNHLAPSLLLKSFNRGTGKWASLLSESIASIGNDRSGHDSVLLEHLSLHSSQCHLPITTVFEHERFTSRIVDLRGWHGMSNISPSPHSLFCFLTLIEMIASHHSVLSVSIQGRPVLLNYDARGFTQSGSSSTPLSKAGLFGEGQIVGVADSGLDDFSCFFWDNSGRYSSSSTTRSGYLSPVIESYRRKVVEYVAYADGSDFEGGHGTHVVGTIVGNSIFDEFSQANGLAPAARVAFFDIMATNSQFLSIPDTYTYLYPTLYNAGARVLSNSWGSYTLESE